MCCIMYIPKTANEPSKNDLFNMWKRNPDGAGIMWLQDGKVYYSKGYFDFDEMYRDFLIIKRDYNYECAIHCRIATSGGINKEMCHPFALTDSEAKIKRTNGKSDVCIMHNGVIPIKNRPSLSDTAEYIIDCLYPQYESDSRFFLHLNDRQKKMLENEIGYSKLLFFCKDGVQMIGDWKRFNDCYCSNLYFVPKATYNYGTKPCYGLVYDEQLGGWIEA